MKSSLFLPVLLGLAVVRVGGATLTVANTHDSGSGSLREAIIAANQTAEADVIVFNLPAGAREITLSVALPPLAGTISILNDGPGDQPITVQRSSVPATPLFGIFETAPYSNVVISGLTVKNGVPAESFPGGGIFNNASRLVLRRCTVTGNSSGSSGGGIASYGGTLDATDCTISGNSARSGGGVYLIADRTVLTNCTISNNTADNGGGLKNDSDGIRLRGELRIKSCTFSANSVRDSGGAIYDTVRNPDLISIVSSTITANVAGQRGGGIIAFNGQTGAYLRLGNTIIAGNNCPSAHGDVYGHDLATGQYETDGHNIVGREPKNVVGLGSTTGLYNGVKGDQVGTTTNPIDPQLGPLQMNGGHTPTHALLIGSPAINNANEGFAPAHDQRGYARPDVADIGAFEYGGTYALPLLNISTRGQVQSGNDVLIAGFIVTGTEPKRLMVRACGPSLGIPGSLANPRLDLWNSAGQVLAANDDWRQAANSQDIINSSLAPINDAESAILITLTPGAYTAVVNGVNNTTGVGLAEVYDLGAGAQARLANISTRGLVGSGDDVMIGGFIVSGRAAERVLIRGLGPSLPFATDLLDPILELRDQNGALLRTNDNWRADQKADIEGTGIPPTFDQEAAIVSSLSPANYTAILRGGDGGVGVALVEIYALD